MRLRAGSRKSRECRFLRVFFFLFFFFNTITLEMLKLVFQTLKVIVFSVTYIREKKKKLCISLFHSSSYFRHIIHKVYELCELLQ